MDTGTDFSASHDRVKLLVLGDTGVGKTALVHLLCHQTANPHTQWTIGSNLDVLVNPTSFSSTSNSKLHEHRLTQKRYFIEFWDVSGQIRYFRSRSVFYDQPQGLILVHDVSNKKSFQNLKKWVRELGQHIDPLSTYQWDQVLDSTFLTLLI